MKTTVRLTPNLRITVEPAADGIVRMGIHSGVETRALIELTPDQSGALVFGIEQAEIAAYVAQQRAA